MALFVDYGQAPLAGERRAAERVAAARGVPLQRADLGDLARLGVGTLAGNAPARIADGTTEEQREEWFPARNLLLASIGTVMLGARGGGVLVFGAQAEGYRDCRSSFFDATTAAMREALPEEVEVTISATGDRERALLSAIQAGLEPRMTFSCNRRSDRHCWRCSSCVERRAFLARCGTAIRRSAA